MSLQFTSDFLRQENSHIIFRISQKGGHTYEEGTELERLEFQEKNYCYFDYHFKHYCCSC